MQVRVLHDAPDSVRADALVLPVFTGGALEGAAQHFDATLNGAIAEILESGEIKGKLCETALVHVRGKNVRRVLLIGLGEREKFEHWMLARYAGTAVRQLGRKGLRNVAFVLPENVQGRESEAASFLVEGALSGGFDTTMYQKDVERRSGADEVAILAGSLSAHALERGVERGRAVGEAVNLARRLALTPANDMTPTHLADEATKTAREAGLDVEIFDEARCRELGMGSFLSVAQGSAQPPKFIVLRYNGNPESKELFAFVGKGITFDTGGISLKPPERMEEMKYDMSGGAGVIAAMSAIGRLKPKLNVVGLVPATENMPGGKATKPGDIVEAMNGKTIEVINTDAEGRLILADALCYAQQLGATRIVDVATLTGACVVALGHAATAAIGTNDEFVQEFLQIGNATGERYWQMPLYEDYSTAMKSDIADLKNTGGRAAGTLTAAAFLKAFVDEKIPWIHLDIAGTAYLENESSWQAKGPTGTPVRAFVALVDRLAGASSVHANGAVTATA